MNYTKPALLAALGAPFLLGLALPSEMIKFQTPEGLVLKKTFSNTSEMTLDEMDMLMNGEPLPFPMDMDITVSTDQTVVVTDTLGTVRGGHPIKVERTFDSLTSDSVSSMSSSMMGDEEMEANGTSELEGLSVVFTWDDDEGEFTVAFAEDSEGDEDLLEGLKEDMDLRVLLPAGDVSEGESWSIDPSLMISVLAPGGNLQIVPEDTEMGGMGMPGGSMNLEQMLGELDGEVTGKLVGLRDVDDSKIAVIAITLEIESTNDLTEFMREMMESVELPPEAGSMEIESFDVEMSIAGEGELLWDITHGHFLELNISTEMDSTMDQAMSMSMGPESMTMEQSMVFSATGNLAYTAERQ
ncbi:hypothetical protein [Engelhardtia mirabilis]|uniref:Uncharacterized protein n=1 Tax=Engelhardtia mirabilis TaxID=2528011 RepID=A0A518BQV7_9BACT|nr:hypothetical protein Pla133_44780 [Planctomycetes bacterium Pla133]QDV03685.1 hypothetical protein Pla86_44760 [Planctomycetes bacterium Pla86]